MSVNRIEGTGLDVWRLAERLGSEWHKVPPYMTPVRVEISRVGMVAYKLQFLSQEAAAASRGLPANVVPVDDSPAFYMGVPMVVADDLDGYDIRIVSGST